MRSPVGRTTGFAVSVLCLLVVCTGGAVALQGGTTGTHETVGSLADGAEPTGVEAVLGQSLERVGVGTVLARSHASDNNETVRHRDPDQYQENGNLNSVEGWLAGRLTERLGNSTVQLSQGEYGLAQSVLGERFQTRLEQYVSVTGETDGQAAGEVLNDTRNEQRRLAELLAEYRETLEAYETALEAGNVERARGLARELVDLGAEIEAVSVSLQQLYDEIEALLGVEPPAPTGGPESVTDTVQSRVEQIRTDRFVDTELRVAAESTDISFLEPLAATGRLVTADGEPVANDSLRLAVGNTTLQVESDANGTFGFTYRPTAVALDRSALSVRYLPPDQSVYTGSEASLAVDIEQVAPRLGTLAVPDELAYGRPAAVNGTLLAGDVPIDGVSLVVSLAGRRVGTVDVSGGSFDSPVEVPASVPAGAHPLVVALPFEDRALAGVSGNRSVRIRRTGTALTMNATQSDNRTLVVTGELETSSGVGVGGELVELQVAGAAAGAVTTAADGGFETTVTVPDDLGYGELSVTASYRGEGSNLGSAEAGTVVTLDRRTGTGAGGRDQSGGTSGGDRLPAWVVAAGGVGVLLVLGAALWVGGAGEDGSGQSQSDPTAAATREEPSTATVLIEHASDRLQSRPDAAVQASYLAVRREFAEQFTDADTLTHWEFYRRYRDDEDGRVESAVTDDDSSSTDRSVVESLQEITEEYERATFSPEDVSPDSARRALDRARRLCRVSDGDQPAPASADD